VLLPDSIDAVRPSIVQIAVDLQDQPGSASIRRLGTGFIIDADFRVITALHVVQRIEQAWAKYSATAERSILVGYAQPNADFERANFTFIAYDAVKVDARHDLAVLEPRADSLARGLASLRNQPAPVDIDASRPRDGESIAVSGYPLAETVLITTSGAIASSWPIRIEMVPATSGPPWWEDVQIDDVYLGDVFVNPGNSGGPVYRVDDCRVVGVCVAYRTAPISGASDLSQNSGLTEIVPIKYATALVTSRAT
jgi:S1-C subfamily serine protease